MSVTERRTPLAPPAGKVRDIIYVRGQSSVGDFIAAADKNGLCAILLGDHREDFLARLKDAFPARHFTHACPTYGAFLVSAVTRLIERP